MIDQATEFLVCLKELLIDLSDRRSFDSAALQSLLDLLDAARHVSNGCLELL